MSDLDAIVIGAGHNGLTCAAYLGMAGLRVRVVRAARCRRRRRRDRGISSRLPQLDRGLHGEPAAAQDHRRSRAARHGLRIVERRAQNFLPLPDGRYLLTGEGRTSARSRSSAQGRRTLRRLSGARSAASPTCCVARARARRRISAAEFRPKPRANSASSRPSASGCGRRRPHGGVRPPAQIGRRHARRLVRVRSDQGRARLRCGGRQSGEPLHAGLGLCAAASRVRRSERQARVMGPRHRRHGRHHAGNGERRRRPRRAHRCGRGGARSYCRSAAAPRASCSTTARRCAPARSSPMSIRNICSKRWCRPDAVPARSAARMKTLEDAVPAPSA